MGEVSYMRKEYEPGHKQLGEAENTYNTGNHTAAATEFTDGVTKVRDNVRNQLDLPSRAKDAVLGKLQAKYGHAMETASDDSDVWGTWFNIVTRGAKLFGDKAALKALKEGEMLGKRELEKQPKNIKAGIKREKAKIERIMEKFRRHIKETVAPVLLEGEKFSEDDISIISNLAQEMLMREEGKSDKEIHHLLEILYEEDKDKKISKAPSEKSERWAKIKKKWESLYLSDEEFAKGWLLQVITNELLKYSIEDDYVEIDDVAFEVIPSLQELIERNDWVNPSLLRVLKASRKLAKKEPLPTRLVELRIPTPTGICPIVGKIPLPGKPPIPVSSISALFAPILEDSIAHPYYRNKVVDTFAERLIKLRDEVGVTCLCFIEKSAGPVGALAMLSDLVRETNLPACIYRESYLSARTKLSGYQPISNKDKVAIVYDLIVTGHGVQQAANYIETKFRTTVTATVVLLSYDKEKRSTLEIGNGHVIHVESIGWYEDYISEFERIRESSVVETERVKVLEVIPTNGETEHSLVGGKGTTVTPPRNGGDKMVSSHRPDWGDEELRYGAMKPQDYKEYTYMDFNDFTDFPLRNENVNDLEKKFHVRILFRRSDDPEWCPVRICGKNEDVDAFLSHYVRMRRMRRGETVP